MQASTSSLPEAQFLEMILSEQASAHGPLYGLNALQIMGKAAFVCATRHARGPVVMAKADCIEFFRPVPQGSIIAIRAHIAFQGQSSMTVIAEIAPEDCSGKDATPAITGRFMMIAVDDKGHPVPVPVSDQPAKEELHP